MKVVSQTIRENVSAGIICGIMAWTAYAIVEACFSSILPWMIKPSYDYVPLHWGFTALLFVIYPLIGLILGGLSGLCFSVVAGRIQFLQKVQPATFFSVVTTSTLVLAFDVNLVANGSIGLPELPPLSTSLLLAFGLGLSTKSSIWGRRLRYLMNPWTASMILLGLAWIVKELLSEYSRAVIAVGTLAYTFSIFLISFIIKKTAEKRRISSSYPAYQARSLSFLIPVVFVVLGISFFLEQTPIRKDLNVKTWFSDANLPNVILIMMDTVRADHLSLYGYERNTTININKFAETATLYTRPIASGDFTLSTHASIFTGMYARQHGAHNKLDLKWHPMPLANKFHTLAEVLSENGYLTMGISANAGFVSHRFNMDQGFQYFDSRSPVRFYGRTDRFYLRQFIRNILSQFALTHDYEKAYRKAEDINKEVFTLLEKVQQVDRPFFLFINYMDAHSPYLPSPPFDTLWPGKEEIFKPDWYRKTFGEVMTLKRKITEKESNHLNSQYDGEIAYLDSHIGELITRLKERGLHENSLIIITSDHGEAFGERNFMQHGFAVYQDQIYVPLIIKYPNTKEACEVNESVNSVDIMPTVLDMLGYEIPEEVQGRSLLELETLKSRFIITESFPNPLVINWHRRFDRTERAIFSGSLKYITSTAGKRELYDLSKDPDEKRNLYNSADSTSERLGALLNNWLQTTVAEAELSSPIKLQRETLRRLRALGYVQ